MAIADALEADLRAGRLAPGTRLPAQRELAFRLKVALGTVGRAYAEAERRGLIGGEVGRGTFVRAPDQPDPAVAELYRAGAVTGDALIDMATNRPPSGAGNAAAVARALRAVAAMPDLAASLTDRLDGIAPRYRIAGARWLARSGVDVPADRVVLTGAGQPALVAAIAAVTRSGERILCEAFTDPGLKSAAALLDRELVPLPMDADGLCPDALARALEAREARVVCTVPDCHNPTAITQPEQRRRDIAAVIRRFDALAIEDAVHAFLNPAPIPALATLAPERTIHLTAMSKVLAPAVRLGFIAAPEGFAGRVAAAVGATGLMVPAIFAAIAARAIEDGTAARLADQGRGEALARATMARTLLGPASCPSPAALTAWLPLAEPGMSETFVAEARRRGVAVVASTAFAVGRPTCEAVRISLAAAADRSQLERGLRIIAGMRCAVR
ncbi:MAG: PLP-dependent aminotransferase family protein [Magnetospirillum sp.]|nr:PLP-dependent aminotransferase family protein [Magnetospirillum sp.]